MRYLGLLSQVPHLYYFKGEREVVEMSAQLGWLALALGLVASATVGLCLGHISSVEYLTIVGPSGVLGAAGVHLSAATPQPGAAKQVVVTQVPPGPSA